MANEPQSPLRDKDYNLVATVEILLKNVWQLDTYIRDAEGEGDTELAEWFRTIQENNRKAGEKGKQMLSRRLQD